MTAPLETWSPEEITRLCAAVTNLAHAYFITALDREDLRPYVTTCLHALERAPGGRPQRRIVDLDAIDRTYPSALTRHTRTKARS